MLKIIELFSGIGAARWALDMNTRVKPLFYSEINQDAIKAYQALFNDYQTPNLGDIRNWQDGPLDQYAGESDILIMGLPYQDFSHAGKNKGGEKNSNTRSSLLWCSFEVIKKTYPRYVVFENVKNILTNKKHAKVLQDFIYQMALICYKCASPTILNSLNFGIPQNRERVFIIFARVPRSEPMPLKIKTNLKMLEHRRGPLEPLSEYLGSIGSRAAIAIKQKVLKNHKLLDVEPEYNYPNFMTWTDAKGNKNSSYNRAWKVSRYCEALNTTIPIKVVCQTIKDFVFELNSQDYARLMGFDVTEYHRIKKVVQSESKLKKLFGNSNVVPVIQALLDIIV